MGGPDEIWMNHRNERNLVHHHHHHVHLVHLVHAMPKPIQGHTRPYPCPAHMYGVLSMPALGWRYAMFHFGPPGIAVYGGMAAVQEMRLRTGYKPWVAWRPGGRQDPPLCWCRVWCLVWSGLVCALSSIVVVVPFLV